MRASKGNRKVNPPPQEQKVLVIFIFVRQKFYIVGLFQDLVHLCRYLKEVFQNIPPGIETQITQAAKLDSVKNENGNHVRISLGRSNCQFRPCMYICAGSGLPSYG